MLHKRFESLTMLLFWFDNIQLYPYLSVTSLAPWYYINRTVTLVQCQLYSYLITSEATLDNMDIYNHSKSAQYKTALTH